MWAGDLNISDVDNALKAAGVPDEALPKAPSRATAMRRAIEEIAPRGAKVDSLPKGLGVAMSLKDVSRLDLEALSAAAGYAVREASSYSATLTAKILVQNVNGTEIETLSFSPEDHPMVPLVREVYRAKRDQYKASEDLSVWFSQTIIPSVGGIGKRARGGVYYVPASRRDLLLSVARGLEAISAFNTVDRNVAGMSFPVYLLTHGGKICLEPRTGDDSAAMEIMVDGVIREVDGTLKELIGILQTNNSGDKTLGKRALATKKAEALELEAYLQTWQASASFSSALLQDRLMEIQNAISFAETALELSNAIND
jgi:hypothetical protein